MKDFLKERKLALIVAALGAAGGFLYWRFVGCTSGTCPIRSVWYLTTLWGAVMGYLFGDLLNDLLNRKKKGEESQ